MQRLLRTDRIRRACDKKFPKLAVWKRMHGARTILVLEDNDVQLNNQVVVTETYLPLSRARPDPPDETYLLATAWTLGRRGPFSSTIYRYSTSWRTNTSHGGKLMAMR